jgi:hypothetical protein
MQAGQQFGLAQERAVGRRGAAHHEVVAAAGAGMAAVGHELLGRQARFKRGLVQELGVLHQFAPVVRGVDVDLDHARIGRDLQQLQAGVARRRVALQHDLHAQGFGRGLDGGQQVQVVLQPRQRWHEDVEHTVLAADLFRLRAVGTARVAHLHAQRGAGEPWADSNRVGGCMKPSGSGWPGARALAAPGPPGWPGPPWWMRWASPGALAPAR